MRDAILDGEVLAIDAEGHAHFLALMRGQGSLHYATFDLLWLNGRDLRAMSFAERKRRLERSGHRFQSECDSEIIAVYLAEKMTDGASLEDAMHASLEELDGVFTYMAVTADALGVAKDEMAAKPLVLYESDEVVALASEEIAIRAVLDREIETYDLYESEVFVWQR